MTVLSRRGDAGRIHRTAGRPRSAGDGDWVVLGFL